MKNGMIELDETFFKIFNGIVGSVINITEQSVQQVLESSKPFLSESIQSALKEFHELYNSQNSQLTNQKQSISQDVDDIFESVQKALESGEDIEAKISAISENDEKKKMRLGLSALQKTLESLVTVDAGLRQKLVPVLMSMQFEDFTKQVLSRIDGLWNIALKEFHSPGSIVRKKTIAEMTKVPASKTEIEFFYKIILQKEVPATLNEDDFNFMDLVS